MSHCEEINEKCSWFSLKQPSGRGIHSMNLPASDKKDRHAGILDSDQIFAESTVKLGQP